jgi:hypothetical protein
MPQTIMQFPYSAGIVRKAEQGKLDTIFFQDTAAVGGSGALNGTNPYRPTQGGQV